MRSRNLARAAFVLIASAAMAGSAAAQAEQPTPARLRLGPLQLTPTLELRDMGLDTNVYNENVSKPVKDFAFTFIPAVRGTLGFRRVTANVASLTDLVYFARQTTERSANEDLSGSVRLAVHRFAPYLEGGYLNTRERVSTEIDARARRIETRGAAGLDITLTPKVSGYVRGDLWRTEFDGAAVFDQFQLAEELNRKSTTVSGGVRYALSPLTTLLVAGDSAQIRFIENPTRDTDTSQVLAGLEFNPRALINGAVRLGVQRFRPRSAILPDFDGLVGSAALSYRLGPGNTLGFLFERRTEFSYVATEPYYLRQNFGGSFLRQVSRQWGVEFNASRATHRYRSIVLPTSPPPPGHVERIRAAGVSAIYDLGPRSRVTTRLAYQGRSSDLTVRQFNGVVAGVSISYGF